jgi:hypothetical protein
MILFFRRKRIKRDKIVGSGIIKKEYIPIVAAFSDKRIMDAAPIHEAEKV